MRTTAGRALPLLAMIASAGCGGATASQPARATETAGAAATAIESSADAGAAASSSPSTTTASTEATAGPNAASGGAAPAAGGTGAVGAAGASVSKPAPERPYASTAAEARSLIDEQIRGRMEALWQCVAAYIAAGMGAHRKVALDFGIDQDGRFIGVTVTGARSKALDPAARACVADALRDAVFPRSKSAITTVRETFTASATSGGS